MKSTAQKKVSKAMYDKALLKFKNTSIKMEELSVQLNKAIELAGKGLKKQLEKLEADANTQFDTVHTYCEQNRDTLFPEDVKSLETPHGTVGFRTGKHKVIIEEGVKPADIIKALKAARWKGAKLFLKPKYELDKTKIINSKDDKKIAEHLEKTGVTVDQDETFYIDTNS